MSFPRPMQKVQDWLTQQWVIVRGRKIDPNECIWLMGPFGNSEIVGESFINELAANEKLTISRETTLGGLIPDMASLNLPEAQRLKVLPEVVDFYENTARYNLQFSVRWNLLFKGFGILISKLFSNRLGQLNIPIANSTTHSELDSKIIALAEPDSGKTKYTFWLRSIKSSGDPIYSGVYGVGTLPSGIACIKAVFPLPNGNATVMMTPAVGPNGELILESSGKEFGDAGFYFLLKDSKGDHWAHYVKSFRDRLTINATNGKLAAEQVLTLWRKEVLRFNYNIEPKK